MVYNNKVEPICDSSNTSEQAFNNNGPSLAGSGARARDNSVSSSREFNDFDSISTIQLEESSYLKLKPFTRLDPSLMRLLRFLQFFGLFINTGEVDTVAQRKSGDGGGGGVSGSGKLVRYFRVTMTLLVAILTSEVVYDVNLRQSKLLAEQKRSTPLLTFVIVAYSWLTLVIPLICDVSLILTGPYLFRFYSRTTATVCNGIYFGRVTSSDTLFYYLTMLLLAFLDVVGQVVLLGVWPASINPYMSVFLTQNTRAVATMANLVDPPPSSGVAGLLANSTANTNSSYALASAGADLADDERDLSAAGAAAASSPSAGEQRITAYLLDSILGEHYAHSDLGVCIKIICLVIQNAHSYSFLVIIISLSDHYAAVINSINENLDKYEFRRLLKQLIILRDSSEQISLMISVPFSLIIMLVFMRQIALNGVFIQSTMQPYENWAVSLQSFTCSVCIFMVFIYCDGLQSASKQTHRLKTEQTVINENRGGNQSIYEFLDYLDRLSKSIRITFFNIIAINKSSLVGLFGHILSLTFVTS